MGLFTKRKRRPSRRAEAKALKHKAGLEAKLVAKNDRKARRAQTRNEAKVAKAQISVLQAEEKTHLKLAARAERELFSAGQVKKYLGVARVLIPVLAPLAYRGATFLRAQLDNRRANQLGIGIDKLGEFTGHGARLQARIANTQAGLDKIGDEKFVSSTRDRLSGLAAAVQTAEQMPTPRRRAVHTSIAGELNGIEADVLTRLGVH